MARLGLTLRALLASSLALALWTLARPALAASAPFCDDRAASASAPPPALEAPDVGIQRAKVEAACAGEDRPLGTTVRHGRSRSASPAVAHEAALSTRDTPLVGPPETTFDPPQIAESARQGVRPRIERPPRD
jgi:hypothetical protein